MIKLIRAVLNAGCGIDEVQKRTAFMRIGAVGWLGLYKGHCTRNSIHLEHSDQSIKIGL